MKTREVLIVGARHATEWDVHAKIARELEFPHHYGRNLSALADCLGDVSTPTRVKLDLRGVDDERMARFYERMALVLERAARENPLLEVSVTWPDSEE